MAQVFGQIALIVSFLLLLGVLTRRWLVARHGQGCPPHAFDSTMIAATRTPPPSATRL